MHTNMMPEHSKCDGKRWPRCKHSTLSSNISNDVIVADPAQRVSIECLQLQVHQPV